MKDRYEELVNKYIDKKLSNDETREVNELSKNSNEFKSILNLQKVVHLSLSEMTYKEVPLEITSKVMSKITSAIKVKYEKHYFFRVIIGIFLLLFISILFVLSSVVVEPEVVKEISSYTTSTKNHFFDFLKPITNIFDTEIFRMLSFLFSFIVLLFFYFKRNLLKDFEKRIEQY